MSLSSYNNFTIIIVSPGARNPIIIRNRQITLSLVYFTCRMFFKFYILSFINSLSVKRNSKTKIFYEIFLKIEATFGKLDTIER